jgi:hypothetical protein
MRERRDVERLGSHLAWPVSRGYPEEFSSGVHDLWDMGFSAWHNSFSATY